MTSIVGMKLVFWKFLREANIVVPTQNEGCEELAKNVQFKLVLWTSSSDKLLARSHFLLVLVNDFVHGWIACTLPIGQVCFTIYSSQTTGREFFRALFCVHFILVLSKGQGEQGMLLRKTKAITEVHKESKIFLPSCLYTGCCMFSASKLTEVELFSN